MNSLAACFDYTFKRWLDLDRYQFNVSYFAAKSVKTSVLKLAQLSAANIVKSHHDLESFGHNIGAVADAMDILNV